MKLGIFGLNMKLGAAPDVTMRLARRCEELGYESWWAGEHVVLPSPRVPPSPMEPGDDCLDPLVHLAFVAAATSRLVLGTGIIILPQRNPLVLAKQVASLDRLSGGRFQLGVGVGYLEPELNAIGVTLAERASRTDDALGAMRAIWYDPAPVSFHGAHTSFDGLDANPRPLCRVPIVVGGHTPSAFRRAVEQGDGWYGFHVSPEQTARHLAALADTARTYDRPAALGALEISVTPNRPLTAESLASYAEAGVDRVIVNTSALADVAAVEAFVEQQAAVAA